ncbi:N-(5'-phosphoribosyl)anthranilate isomerase [Halorubrum sp. Ib24]|uniref:phosphoribosylanthranilate isomerase n=1 Tax=unclassified Halorubrum TaxID=2642239 RepID=UPI000B9910A9|nr:MULTISPECIES: phosphoribosylanthranilate isomerase [unclassified Halorubrum]OYR42359.1 N-(5'-phosphoribosyl)anthranilate isomerase [Halorubrum sp. Ib24]OYR45425.1 N-(5'-phosphoribosyl)anthranilate isomerase [Halorubrum sp. Hd13]OYR45645.1 N-(5'-phosphoribosyl)anthranilate isomerase [Halorubrum sp. Ea8]OYR49603.1 N-(5'-phosphoribosyl)anthranilate isomerase [Halorubrum sp. Eb13]OYR51096.1 N-(5'-phosphoribosyl)anthranilate isomerase [Halorubrum sp. Ea1]
MARVKICGLTDAADLRAAVDAGADAVGVISEVPVDSGREVDSATAAELLADVPPFVTATLVTMPDSAERAVELLRTVGPDAIQLHGEWTPDEIRYIRAETERKVLLAVDADDPARAEEFDAVADALVIDSTDDSGAGGTGEAHDWAKTGELAARLTSPVVLAGGLTADNVAEAVRVADPYAVDVASGVELADGRKDHNAVARFVANAGREMELA